MGPRFNGVEDKLADCRAKHNTDWASMGPRFNGVEDNEKLFQCPLGALLQWGHALMAWKTSVEDATRIARILLQWGHALMAWKTRTSNV